MNKISDTSGKDHGVRGIGRADWFALAGIAAVDFTRNLYQPGTKVCSFKLYAVRSQRLWSNID